MAEAMRAERRHVAVMTSGGDAPGMNPAVRAAVRAALSRDFCVSLIRDGWAGCMRGDVADRVTWTSVSHVMQAGGTFLGTARALEFRRPEGRREACFQLCSRGIDALICIGGDGSLTGASILRSEWNEHVKSLVSAGRLKQGQATVDLDLVGLVGSIDNDLVGFTQTIGADSCLHRIAYSIDCIVSTAASHGRTFVVEVMGRNSGYLALASAMITSADWVFLPERPVDHDTWKRTMCEAVTEGRKMRRRTSLIILAEGAIDTVGQKISANDVKMELELILKHDVRITTLGHVQRGGSPSAFDRFQGAVLGVAAIDELAKNERGTVLSVVGLNGYQPESKPLMECVQATQDVAANVASRELAKAFAARGSSFADFWSVMTTVSGPLRAPQGLAAAEYPVAVMTVGAPAPGMNHCVRAVTRLLLARGHRVFFVRDGFAGLDRDAIDEADWMSVSGWASKGGAFLGTGRTVPGDARFLEKAKQALHKRNCRALVVIGGYEAYAGALSIRQAIPDLTVTVIPATISLNVPGSEVSIGMDKASNNLTSVCDNIKQSALGYTKRVFVVESIGRSCGFQSLFGAICSGAEQVFLPERPPKLEEMDASVSLMRRRFQQDTFQLGLIINSETASKLFTTDFIRQLHEDMLADLGVTARGALLSGLQQGGDPSPMDRIFSGRLALAAVDCISNAYASGKPVAVGCGLVRDERHFIQLEDFPDLMDQRNRRPKNQPWLEPLLHVFEAISIPPENKSSL